MRAGARRWGQEARPTRRRRNRGDPGAGADRRLDIALGQQLLVDLDDRPPCDSEQLGKPSSRGEPLAGAESPVADRRSQLVLDLRSKWSGVAVQCHEQIGAPARPLHSHGTSTPNGPLLR